jgi:hypothetical protein
LLRAILCIRHIVSVATGMRHVKENRPPPQ